MRSFEDYNTVKNRVQNRLEKENNGIVKRKKHTGIIDKMQRDKDGLMNEINTLIENNTKITNLSELTKKYE